MSKFNQKQLVDNVKLFVKNNFSDCKNGDFYVGITDNPMRRLGEHRSTTLNLYTEAIDIADARQAEKELLKLGFKGGSRGGDDSSVFLYVYLITSETEER